MAGPLGVRELLQAVVGQGNATKLGEGDMLDLTPGGLLDSSLSTMFILSSSYLVFWMQCGFALLEAGSVRLKNMRNILLKNVIDACISVVAWWSLGSAFQGAFHCGGNPFIGTVGFFTTGDVSSTPLYHARWIFGWAFSATAATIVSGAVAERTQFRSYLLYTCVITSVVYPVVAHWVWSPAGWLSPTRTDCATGQRDVLFSSTVGMIDFSGSGVVHITGGAAALMGAWVAGPRLGRFTQEGHLVDMPGCNPAQQALGTFILWLGWYGFNPGSTQCFYGCMQLAARIAVNTTLGAGSGGLATLLLIVVLGNPGDVGPVLNGILAGLVSITGSCAVIDSYAAVIIGGIGGGVYVMSSRLLRKARIDDPLDASAVHLCCGIWGVIAGGLFATQEGVLAAYQNDAAWGAFYGGGGAQLGVQLLGALSIFAWSAFFTGSLFMGLRALGWLRVTEEDEKQGLDYVQGIGSGVIGCSCLQRT